jgi:hypothetical protein
MLNAIPGVNLGDIDRDISQALGNAQSHPPEVSQSVMHVTRAIGALLTRKRAHQIAVGVSTPLDVDLETLRLVSSIERLAAELRQKPRPDGASDLAVVAGILGAHQEHLGGQARYRQAHSIIGESHQT